MPAKVAIACLLGAVLAGTVLTWTVFAGRAELADPRPTSDFYDEQARAWFDGRWELPPEVLAIEAFVVDGEAHTYFGPVPALLRVPVLALTDSLDGRLTQPSMLLALGVAMGAVGSLWWRTRVVVRGVPETIARGELVLAGATVAVVGASTVLVPLAGQGIVYHEAIVWGVALSLWSFAHQVTFLSTGRLASLVWAGTFAALALLTRASVGIGPVVSLALVAAVVGMSWLVDRWERGRPARWRGWLAALVPFAAAPLRGRAVLALGAAVLVPIMLYAGVNLARFDEPFRLPIEKQLFTEMDESRQAALEANDGSLFSASYVPSTLWQYLRPDAVGFDGLAPWVTFPREPATVIGDATFDTLSESSSATATMPLLVVLAGVGAVVLVRPGRGVAALRLPVLGAAAGFAGVLVIGFIAHRYLGDVLPVLVLAALVGVHRVSEATVPVRRAALVGAVILGGWGVVANLALAVEHQRVVAPAELDMRYDFIRFQHELDGHSYRPTRVDDEVPQPGERGELVVVGDCSALLWSNGASWFVLEGEVARNLVPPREARSTFGEVVATVDEPARETTLCEQLVP